MEYVSGMSSGSLDEGVGVSRKGLGFVYRSVEGG